LIKNAAKWTLKLENIEQLRPFYDDLMNRLTDYGIFLKPYQEINANEGLEAITMDNCKNYETAKESMSKALFMLFDTNKDKMFETYPIAITIIDAYRHTYNGLGFLRRLMQKRHPALKDFKDIIEKPKPQYLEYKNIHRFITSYMYWLKDEELSGKRYYSDKEKLNWVLTCLDDERWNKAKVKVNTILDDVYANKKNIKPFPSYLKLSDELGHYLTDLIPEDEQERLTNDTDTSGAILHTTKFKPYNNKNKHEYSKNKYKRTAKTPNFAKDLKWEVIPNAVCPACGKNNHNIYLTGCPTMAQFCACKEFYDKTPPEQLEPVKASYQKYLREIQKKMKLKRKNDREILRKLTSKYDAEDMDNLKTIFFDEYKEKFNEDQYNDTNPYSNLDYDTDDDEDGDNPQYEEASV
jgi:hypothetical protein